MDQMGPSPYVKAGSSKSMFEWLRAVSDACIECNLCQKECAFLRKYGNPKTIADTYDPTRKEHHGMPFECSLCGLCRAVCPVSVDPAGFFLEMRREAVRCGEGNYPEHETLRSYERRGTSRTYSYYALPEGCDTVFFPGCTLSGTRSEKVVLAYQKLREKIPSLGVVLDCCTKPSHDLGRDDHFTTMFDEMRGWLMGNGVTRVIVACPNCYKIFDQYGAGLSITSIYELLLHFWDSGNSKRPHDYGVTIHDSCAVRSKEEIHKSVRDLIARMGYLMEEMAHSGGRTLCCGEGGAVGPLVPDLAGNWSTLREREARGRKVVTYCAGCAGVLRKRVPAVHILDLLWGEKERRPKIAKPPLTYWKRLKLKKWFKKNVPAAITRERTFFGKEEPRRSGTIKFLIFLLFLAGVIVAVKTSGVSRYLEEQTLRNWISHYGAWAPIAYMLIYAIAPALFLPGLPITIVGGILFGPFWGVVYAITGATLGACVAFLVSRYLARQWVEGQLKSPKWRNLDNEVEKHGWKVVAFTRLIPLFPFNLLNYAFGLTKIGFRQYAVTTFICMLPACVAFIVFSSSLLDLMRGRISLTFIIGIVLVIFVSITPSLYRRYKEKHGGDGRL